MKMVENLKKLMREKKKKLGPQECTAGRVAIVSGFNSFCFSRFNKTENHFQEKKKEAKTFK